MEGRLNITLTVPLKGLLTTFQVTFFLDKCTPDSQKYPLHRHLIILNFKIQKSTYKQNYQQLQVFMKGHLKSHLNAP